jgi:DNA-binding NtrC family response regulator
VGGTRDISVRVRVIAATNRELAREVDNGRFRSDLYYRLKVVPLTLPPLRERAEDILPLAHHFRERFNKTFGKNFSLITPAAEQRLVEHPWPGNIRELKNLLERTILLGKGEAIDVEHLALEPARRGAGNGRPAGGHPVLSDVETLLLADIPTSGIRLESIVEEIERAAILKASEQTGWNQTRTSALLGINRDKLRYRMKVYGISRDREEAVGHSID